MGVSMTILMLKLIRVTIQCKDTPNKGHDRNDLTRFNQN